MERNDCPNVERTRYKGAIVKSSNWHIAEKNKDDYPKHLLNTAHRLPQAFFIPHSSFFIFRPPTVASSSDNESEEGL